MSGKGATFDNDLLKLIFNAAAISLIADNTATTPLTNLFISLHTADPGPSGANSTLTNEISYTGYARVAVARTSGGFVVTGASVSPAANIVFGTMTAGAGGTVTFWAVGTLTTGGAGKILYSGAVTPSIVVANGVTPTLTTGSTVTES